MKKIFKGLIIVLLALILYIQYSNYTRYSPPSYFNYEINDSVDVNYYDPLLVQEYFKSAYEIGSFARQLWFNKGIDIRFPDEDKPETNEAVEYYKRLVSTTRIIEKKLILSNVLKKDGFTNKDIKIIVEQGVSPDYLAYQQLLKENLALNELETGDVGQEVWELQKLLIAKGFNIPKDGTFGEETRMALIEFQKSKDLFPSGKVNIPTIKELVK